MEQNLNRRRFLGAAAGTGAMAGLGALAPSAFGKKGRGHGYGRDHDHAYGRSGYVPKDRRGMQLYTMRRVMGNQQDAERALYALGRMGYTEVETAGHYGWTVEEFKRVLRRAGLRAVSGHDGFDLNPANTNWQDAYRETLEYAAELGQKYTGLAWFGPPYTEERFRFIASRMQEAGQIAKHEFGLQFFYHNHDFEFSNKQANGEPLYNIFLETDEKYVKMELDLFWIVEGGANPVEYLSADPDRYPLYHVKDHVWGDRPDAPDWEDVGPGMLDFPDLFDAGDGRERGWGRGLDKHYIIEHDRPQLSHPGDEDAEFKTAWNGIQYLRKVRW